MIVETPETDRAGSTRGEWIVLPLRQAYFAIHRAAGSKIEGEGVTAEQFTVLMVLSVNEGATQNELGASSFTDANTLSAMLKLLEEKELVERRDHPRDRRARAVHLTNRGRELVERLRQDVEPVRARLREVVGEENIQPFIDTLNRLAKAAQECVD